MKQIVPFFAAFFCVLYALTAFAEGAGNSNHEQTTFLGDWLPRLINFAVIAVAVYFLARTPVRDFFKNRSIEIAGSMQESHEVRERAMADLAEMERKIKNLEMETNKMIADAQARGEKEKNALQEESRIMVQDIQHQIKQSIEVEVRKAKSSLATEAALLSLDLAESSIKKNISSKDHTQIIKEYISNVGGKG